MTTSHDNISFFSPQELYCIDVRQCSLYFASYCFCIMFHRFQQKGWRIYDLHTQTFSTPRSNAQGFPSLYSLHLMHLVSFYCSLVSISCVLSVLVSCLRFHVRYVTFVPRRFNRNLLCNSRNVNLRVCFFFVPRSSLWHKNSWYAFISWPRCQENLRNFCCHILKCTNIWQDSH